MKYQDRKRKNRKNSKNRWTSMAIAGAAMLAAAASGGCLYTVIPATPGPSTNYHAPADTQPAQSSQSSNDQTDQNKQQNGTPQNGAPSQGQGGATP
jgi:hypothetical protein